MSIWIYLNISWCILLYLTFFWICLRYLRWTLYKIDCVYFSGMAGAFFWNPSPGRGSWLPNWFCREPLIEGFSMILVFYFVVGSHFGFLRLLFCSEFGGTLLDGLVFCREPFSTKSPVSTLAWNEQGDPFVRACNLCNPPVFAMSRQSQTGRRPPGYVEQPQQHGSAPQSPGASGGCRASLPWGSREEPGSPASKISMGLWPVDLESYLTGHSSGN